MVAEGAPVALGVQDGGATILKNESNEVVADISEIDTAFLNMPFAIEFCSGTVGLTAQIRKLGLDVLACCNGSP